MSVECASENKEEAYLLSTVERLESEFKNITDQIFTFKEELSSIKDEQVHSDLKNIDTAADRFKKITSACYDVGEQGKLLNEDHLREVRHDMRAAVGAIMGYIELIQDSLDDTQPSQKDFDTAISIHKAASNILLTIEGFCIGKSNSRQ